MTQWVRAPGLGVYFEELGDDTYAPAYDCLYHLARNSISIITAGDELRTWRTFGETVGTLEAPDKFEFPADPQPLTTLKGLARELETAEKYPLTREAAGLVYALAPHKPCSRDRRPRPDGILGSDLDRLDRRVRKTLTRQAPPAKLLELDHEQLVFFGARYYIHKPPPGRTAGEFKGKIPRPEAAFLWVLAERPGQEVSRNTIRGEGQLGRSEAELQYYATRLRRLLRESVNGYYARKRPGPPEHADSCFIVGDRGEHSTSGPYTLKLDPGRVWVSPNRPGWM